MADATTRIGDLVVPRVSRHGGGRLYGRTVVFHAVCDGGCHARNQRAITLVVECAAVDSSDPRAWPAARLDGARRASACGGAQNESTRVDISVYRLAIAAASGRFSQYAVGRAGL